ncbi:MAG: SET domain-containing methyltransferase [Nannocystaceae bacterium]
MHHGESGEGGGEATTRERAWVSEKVAVLPHGDGRAVYAVQPIDAGERLIALAHVFVDLPHKYTIQLDDHLHQAGTGEADDFLNHSCDPNAAFRWGALELVALRPIAAGALITFDYLISEWDMRAPFRCECGAERCRGEIRGFRFLDAGERARIRRWVAPYLLQRIDVDVPESPSAAEG